MTYRFIDEAREELQSSVEYYDRIVPELGQAFLDEVEHTIERLLLYPESAPVFVSQVRKAVLRRFPFNILYHATESQLIIVALMHQKRKPGYWKVRIPA